MVNLIMQPEHVLLIERKIKTQTRRLVKYQGKSPLPSKHRVNWRYWICPSAKWKLGNKFFKNDEELKQFTGQPDIHKIQGLKRCRNTIGIFRVRTIPTNEAKNDFKIEPLLNITRSEARKEGYSTKQAFLKIFYAIYARQKKAEARKSLKLVSNAKKPFDNWLRQNRGELWNPLVRVIEFRFLPNTERGY